MNPEKKDVKIEIKVDEAKAGGVFSNFANISHSPEEFIVDFLFINPTPPQAFGKLVSRVILTPGHAKRILLALSENISKYEKNYGEIEISHQPENITRNLQ
ncbi:MAG: DUF3467 domain-containing protein [Spirochaetota bacterium]|nr:DUF3467 domain-containing protein [Spirochaetota bacterium]